MLDQQVIDPGNLPPDMPPVGGEAAFYNHLAQSYPFFDTRRRVHARNYGLRRYPDYCETHGLTHFSVRLGHCLACNGRIITSRIEGRRAGARVYPAHCILHGAGDFFVVSGKCTRCVTSSGAPRSKREKNINRLAARKAGDRMYLAECLKHGSTQHDTIHGKCLTCFTTTGTPRKMMRIDP